MIRRRHVLIGAGAAVLAGAGYYALGRGGPTYEDMVDTVWAARTPAADGEFRYLVHYATLAANSHNTQPWFFEQSGDTIRIRPDMARATPAADPDNHHLYASLGCAGENLMLAANAIGRGASLDFVGEGDGTVEIDLTSGTTRQDPMFDAILERQCTRSDYDGRSVAADDLKQLEAAANVDGCHIHIVSDQAMIEQILELSVAANTQQIKDPAFAGELKSWIRFNGAHAAETRDGLHSACTGNPSIPRLLGGVLFGMAFTPDGENDKLAKQVRSSSGLAVFVTDRDDKAHWVQSGRSYQRFALQATALGVRHAFVNQPVDIPSVRSEFSKLLGLTGGRADLVVRFGYAPVMPRSLRRPVDSVIV